MTSSFPFPPKFYLLCLAPSLQQPKQPMLNGTSEEREQATEIAAHVNKYIHDWEILKWPCRSTLSQWFIAGEVNVLNPIKQVITQCNDSCLATGEGITEMIFRVPTRNRNYDLRNALTIESTWNSKILSVIRSPVTKQVLLHNFTHGGVQRHSIFHLVNVTRWSTDLASFLYSLLPSWFNNRPPCTPSPRLKHVIIMSPGKLRRKTLHTCIKN